MYPNNFNIKEDYCNNCNSQYSDLLNHCDVTIGGPSLQGRSAWDQVMVPAYNRLALNTLTYPALDPNKTPRLSPFLFITMTSTRAKIAGCFLTISSPSVTEMTTALLSVPNGKCIGQMRLPTFSMKSTSTPSKSIPSRAWETRWASR